MCGRCHISLRIRDISPAKLLLCRAWAKNDGIRDVFRPASPEGGANAADRMLDNPNRGQLSRFGSVALVELLESPNRQRQRRFGLLNSFTAAHAPASPSRSPQRAPDPGDPGCCALQQATARPGWSLGARHHQAKAPDHRSTQLVSNLPKVLIAGDGAGGLRGLPRGSLHRPRARKRAGRRSAAARLPGCPAARPPGYDSGAAPQEPAPQ